MKVGCRGYVSPSKSTFNYFSSFFTLLGVTILRTRHCLTLFLESWEDEISRSEWKRLANILYVFFFRKYVVPESRSKR